MTTWLHFIGGHYQHDYRFILEARRNGISRNVPVQNARGFHYGDTVKLLRWQRGGKLVYAFAEMRITSVILPHELSQKITDKLGDRLELTYSPNSLHIERDCGSYDMCGCWTISSDFDIPDILKAAIEVSGDEKFKVMIGGYLSKEYDPPERITTPIKFSRGFQKSDVQLEPLAEDIIKQIYGIRNYRRK